MRKTVALLPVLLIIFASGCSTFFGRGSAYKETSSVIDLLVEPTLDIGWDTDQYAPEGLPSTKWSDYYDVDGHGYYDVVIVAAEEAFLFPSGAMAHMAGKVVSLQSFMHFLRDAPIFVKAPAAVISLIYIYTGGATAVVGCAADAAFDLAAHDIPVLVVGKPARALYDVLNPSAKSESPRDSGKPKSPKKSERKLVYPTE